MDALLDARPTFYELVMQERLSTLLGSAVRFTLETLSTHYPNLVKIRYYITEITAILIGLLDFYYLKTVDATHSEQFYGLQRTIKSGFRPRLLAVLISQIPKVLITRLGAVGKTLGTVHSLVKIAFMMRYLLFNGMYYSPEYYLQGHKLERGRSQNGIKVGVFLALLLLKALEFWFQGRSEVRSNGVMGRVPAPFPQAPPTLRNLCGICRKPPVRPTALDVSGYVFCETCIKTHLETFGSCPLSGEAADLSNLRTVRS